MTTTTDTPDCLKGRLKDAVLAVEAPADGIATYWVAAQNIRAVLADLRSGGDGNVMLYDLSAIDETQRTHRQGQPPSEFTVVYQLLFMERARFIRLKVPLTGPAPAVPSVSDLWPAANWYERELYDMFGVGVLGHPRLDRLLMPPWWKGHPLRKDYPARATEAGPFRIDEATLVQWEEQLRFNPEHWCMQRSSDQFDYMFLNVGPNHPSTHGVLRVVLQLAGQEVVDSVCDIGYHHRGAEKMGERQSWHTYIPYTDRVDYLSGVMNNFPYVLAVEKLAGIEAPDRAKVIRIMMAELFRIISHLVFYGTFAQDVGVMSPVFYMFTDREHALDIVEAIAGARMHPNWFRIGGVAQDLPEGWQRLVRDFLDYMPKRLDEYDTMVLGNSIFKQRTRGVGRMTTAEAIQAGATGPMLRSTGLAWDLRKKAPYGGYEQFQFDVPVGGCGDCYDRAVVHVEEMRQSLRIIEQCLANMPSGDYKARHPLTTPPLKDRTMHDIETLIDHFLNVTWGPVVPPGEACVAVEAVKGLNSYYLISDGNTVSYRTRIRTPSFPHIQMVPELIRGRLVPDVAAVLGSVDFVLADVDR